MIFLEKFIYKIFIQIGFFIIKIISIFDLKSKKWILGRQKNNLIFKSRDLNKKLIWMHVASLGEYEQGLPILKKLNKKKIYQIAVSFFSPSGYEVINNKHDFVFYYPLDTKQNALKIINRLKPNVLLIIKYDYWYISLEIFKKHKLPIYVISAKITLNFIAFKWYGKWFFSVIKSLDKFFVQDSISFNILKKYNIINCEIIKDTKFDRVRDIINNLKKINYLDKFKSNKLLFVAGSTYSEDDKSLLNVNLKNIKIIIAPHEINKEYILKLKNQYKKIILFSEIKKVKNFNCKILIIDKIGILKYIYQYADFAYIGGGFKKKGLHNILEPAIFGIPVFFGPYIQECEEAKLLINNNAAIILNNINKINFWLKKLINNIEMKKKIGNNAKKIILNQKSSIDKIINNLDFL